jgi:tRNA pseudouridine(38-40) synthase
MSTQQDASAAAVAAPPPPSNITDRTDSNDESTTPQSTNNKNNKRKKHWTQRKQEKRKDRVKRQQDQHTGNRRGLDDEEWESQTPHEGSFACLALREQFQVAVPTFEDSAAMKIPKRKVAMLLGYTGTKYAGFQMNARQRTIHAQVELALYQCQYLSQTNFGFPHKYSWSNSARTDKGVHACAQVVSCKLEILPQDDDLPAARQAINAHLPEDIRVLDIVKVSRAFCAKTQRDRARYTYMIPSFLLYNNREELQKLFTSVLGPNTTRNGRSPRDPLSVEEMQQLSSTLYKFRATPHDVTRLREALEQYEGTFSFHNFTSKKSADDANARRFIISFQTQAPIIMEGGLEWIPTQVVGQSFLLHQIRKMASLAIDVARGCATLETIHHALSPTNSSMNLNLAPAQGLFLDMSIFEGYNRRKTNAHLENLDWITDESTPAVQRWKDFRENVVMKHVGTEEVEQGNFIKYLYVQEYVYDYKNQYKIKEQK